MIITQRSPPFENKERTYRVNGVHPSAAGTHLCPEDKQRKEIEASDVVSGPVTKFRRGSPETVAGLPDEGRRPIQNAEKNRILKPLFYVPY
jgi:NAD(P)-dependent dehydrogenase (short-subunit alcohol dehydrogenase family)